MIVVTKVDPGTIQKQSGILRLFPLFISGLPLNIAMKMKSICMFCYFWHKQNQMKVKALFVLLTSLLMSSSIVTSDDSAIDSIILWNELSWEKMYQKPDEAIRYARKAYSLSRQLPSGEGALQSAKLIGVAHDVTSDLDSALYYYNHALELARQTDDTYSSAGVITNLGLVYLHKGDLIRALSYFLEARTLFEVIMPEGTELASTYNNIGLVYLRIEDYGKALTFLNKSLSIFNKLQDLQGKGAVLNNLAVVYDKTGRSQEAINTLNQSITIKREIQDLMGLCIAYNKMGSLKTEAGNLERALFLLHKAAGIANEIESKNTLISTYQEKQKVYALQGKYQKAILYNRMALDMALEIGTRRQEADSYTYFANLYRHLGDYQKAYHYLQRSFELKDTLTGKKKLGEVYEMQLEFEMQQKSNEIALLQEQQKVKSLEIENQELMLAKRNQQIFIVIGLFCLLLVVALLLYFRYLKYIHVQKLKSEVSILHYKEQQTKKVLDAETKERKRIGEELHDGLGQLLSLIKMNITDQIEHIKPHHGEEYYKLQFLQKLADDAIGELRHVSHNLSPVLLQTKGLAVSIYDLVNRLRKSKKYEVELDVSGLETPMETVIEYSVYRIIQELINNIIRHAEATQISLQLVRNAEELSLFVEDNGKGFDSRKVKTGMGLNNLTTRIENLGASMDIDSMPRRGTIVSVSIPLN